MSTSRPGSFSMQATVKAEAVERLIPAQQWISIGWLRSQVLAKAIRSRTCISSGGVCWGLPEVMSCMPSRRWRWPETSSGVGMSSCGSSSVIKCDGRRRVVTPGTLLFGHT